MQPSDFKGLCAALGCHPERSEGSLRPSRQALRCAYPERSEWAQGYRQYLQMSASTQKVLTSTTAQYKMMYQSLMRQYFAFLRVALH